MRHCYEPPPEQLEPVTSKDQLVESVKYVPFELDKEPQDFVEALGYLGSPFSFPREQLALFLRSIHDKLGEALGTTAGDTTTDGVGQDESMDDDVVLLG